MYAENIQDPFIQLYYYNRNLQKSIKSFFVFIEIITGNLKLFNNIITSLISEHIIILIKNNNKRRSESWCGAVSAKGCGFDHHPKKWNIKYFHFLALVPKQWAALSFAIHNVSRIWQKVRNESVLKLGFHVSSGYPTMCGIQRGPKKNTLKQPSNVFLLLVTQGKK